MDSNQPGITVLLYERSPRLAIALTRVLEKARQIDLVVRGDSPRKLPELVRDFGPDVVLVDSDVPDAELVSLCSELHRTYSVPIVLFSTKFKQNQVRTALETGAHALVSWPFKPRELITALIHAAREPSNSAVASLSELRLLTDADNNLNTGALTPIIEWASREALEQISPRLRPLRGET